MPGSETALEEMLNRVLGDLIALGYVAKLADDLNIGGNNPQGLLKNWALVLQCLKKFNLTLFASKTIIVASLSVCAKPLNVKKHEVILRRLQNVVKSHPRLLVLSTASQPLYC